MVVKKEDKAYALSRGLGWECWGFRLLGVGGNRQKTRVLVPCVVLTVRRLLVLFCNSAPFGVRCRKDGADSRVFGVCVSFVVLLESALGHVSELQPAFLAVEAPAAYGRAERVGVTHVCSRLRLSGRLLNDCKGII